MYLEKVKSEGIAHLSYIIGDGNQAVVIDPRRDCGIYVEIAARHGSRITHIFETHRNEDYVIGSLDLASLTGAAIHHGRALDFDYGEPVDDGDTFDVNDLRLEVLETPGHTMESISIVVRDRGADGTPVGVFTGDALFVGDVGRTDFYPDRPQEVAGMLYDSIFKKLLPLGDQTILYPAHGAGSVCGEGMSSREFSTLGHERLTNPALQRGAREEFVAFKVSERHHQPPYFATMERYNQHGPPSMLVVPMPPPLPAADVASAVHAGAHVVDLRSPEAIAGAFIPDSLAIPVDMLPGYAGYLLDYGRDIVLVPEHREQVLQAVRHLVRMGYDRIVGYLEGGLHAWEVSGRRYDRIGAVHAEPLVERLRSDEEFTLLDVRKHSEWEAGRLEGAVHIFLGELPDRVDELDRSRPVVTFCGSGQRAIIAASILKQHGFEQVEDSLGSMSACQSIGCPIEGS
ncbi:MBL fold metallo-hydrolase [bacterium]|nr:MBL fold metallo-hydrolase [bacterium]